MLLRGLSKDGPCFILGGNMNAIDQSTLTVSSVSIGFDSASPALTFGLVSGVRVKGAIVTVDGDDVRYRVDGTPPDSATGTLLYDGDVRTFDSWNRGVNWISVLEKIRFIRVTSDATLNIEWYD